MIIWFAMLAFARPPAGVRAASTVPVTTPPGPVWFAASKGGVLVVPSTGGKDAFLCDPSACKPAGAIAAPADIDAPLEVHGLLTIAGDVLGLLTHGPASGPGVVAVIPAIPTLGTVAMVTVDDVGRPFGDDFVPEAVDGALLSVVQPSRSLRWLFRVDRVGVVALVSTFVDPSTDPHVPWLSTAAGQDAVADMDLRGEDGFALASGNEVTIHAPGGYGYAFTRQFAKKDVAARAVAWSADGHLYVGTGAGLFESSRVNDADSLAGRWTSIPTGARDVRQIVIDGDDLWLATDIGVVHRAATGALEAWGVAQGLPSNDVTRVFVEGDHRVWVGTRDGRIGVIR